MGDGPSSLLIRAHRGIEFLDLKQPWATPSTHRHQRANDKFRTSRATATVGGAFYHILFSCSRELHREGKIQQVFSKLKNINLESNVHYCTLKL